MVVLGSALALVACKGDEGEGGNATGESGTGTEGNKETSTGGGGTGVPTGDGGTATSSGGSSEGATGPTGSSDAETCGNDHCEDGEDCASCPEDCGSCCAGGGPRVFPKAEGFGTCTEAGRGGQIINVTNLNDSGPGSLREALGTEGPRIVVFDVGGIIELTSVLQITDPYCTVAGETAPDPGILLRDAGLRIGTHDVLVRHLRIRVGDHPNGPTPSDRDGIGVTGNPSSQVVIDHCSISWAIDENMSTWYPVEDITFQYCITAEALHDSLHDKGPHSMGLLIGDASHRFTVHHTLFAHNNQRNPLLKADVTADVVNNVVYNWGQAATHHSNYEGTDLPILANHVGNFYEAGTDSGTYEISFPADMPPGSEIYVQGNIGPNRPDDALDECALCNTTGDWLVDAPHDFEPVTTVTAEEAYDMVLARAGARPAGRDPVDERIVQSVRDGIGSIIDSQDDVGGWPDLPEVAREFDPYVPADPHGDDDGDGWTNIEEVLHQFARCVETGTDCP
jgi:pectate lyase